MTEQPEPYHGEVVHTQEVRGSSPFAPTKKERHHIVVSLFFCGHYVTEPPKRLCRFSGFAPP